MEKNFINYAHRGASEYCPENTLLSFYTGLYMGANGIETDVQITKDNVAVLFHDNTLLRVTGEEGSISDYTLEELKNFWVKKNDLKDKIITLDEFLEKFKIFDLTFAIELKGDKTALPTAKLIEKHGVLDKVIATSFKYQELVDIHTILPSLRLGYLNVNEVTDETLEKMKKDGINEICPEACYVNAEDCKKWHDLGFNVRAWGVKDTQLMEKVLEAGADGMTVNFPDKLTEKLAK